jgi:hypothetical protein
MRVTIWIPMTDRAFHEQQTRGAWILCWMLALTATIYSKFYAPGVLVPVLLLVTANIIFCQKFVRGPTQKGVHTTREVLLLNNNRAISISGLFIVFAVCALGELGLSTLQIGAMAGLATACGLAGARYAVGRWQTPEDLERTARESTAKTVEFRSKYPMYVFAAISVIWTGLSRYLGDSAAVGLIGSACATLGSHFLGALITQQVITRKLLPLEPAKAD